MIYMKKLVLLISILGFVGCSNELASDFNTGKSNNPEEIAQRFLQSGNVQSTDSEWGNKGEVTDMFPVYIKGVNEPSYYECKVKVDGEDAGYILVNVNNTDVEVPVYTTGGKTYTEKFRNELKSSDFKLYRYSNFQYTVESENSRGEAKLLKSTGFRSEVDMENAIEEMKSNVDNYGSAIGIDKELIAESNNDNASSSRAYNQWFEVQLKKGFYSDSHLPTWRLSDRYDDYISDQQHMYVGTPTLAFGKVYAYWAKFKGYEKIFSGSSTSGYYTSFFHSTKVLGDLKQLSNDMDGKSGVALEDRVVKLGKSYGYSFECDVDYGNAWDKGNKVYDRIAAEQPVVIETKSDFFAVEGVKKKYRVRGRRRKRYYHREMWYRVNPASRDSSPYWLCSYARWDADKDVNVDGAYHIWD